MEIDFLINEIEKKTGYLEHENKRVFQQNLKKESLGGVSSLVQ